MLNQNEERLQKALARAGIASRRSCEDLIAAGRVKVNGKVVTLLGTKIDTSRDRVTVDDEPVAVRANATPQKIYIMLNKPAGYLSTVSDPQGRPTIMDLLDDASRVGRLYPVGRLDADSEGLLLLTNDGAFANALSHPRYGVEKEYLALLDGIIAMKDIEDLRDGVPIRVEDPETGEYSVQKTRAAKVDLVRHEGSNSLVRFILKEGKKRQIRLMSEAVEHRVVDLTRVRMGPLKLGDLPSGKHRSLSKAEVHALVESARQRAENVAPPVKGQEAPARPAIGPLPRTTRPGPGRPGPGRAFPSQEEAPARRVRPAAPGRSSTFRSPDEATARRGRPAGPGRDQPFRGSEEAPLRRGRPARPGPVRPFRSPDEDPRRTRRPGPFNQTGPSGDTNRSRPVGPPRRSGPPSRGPDRSGPRSDRPANGGYRSGPRSDRPANGGYRGERQDSGGYRSGPRSDRPDNGEPRSDRPDNRGYRGGPRSDRPDNGGFRGRRG